MPESSKNSPLTIVATVTSGQLEVSVELQNDRTTPLWIASAIPQIRGASIKMQPNSAYVYREDDRTIVGRRWFPVPDDIDVMAPLTPEWTRIAVGERYVSTIVVPWPLIHHRPYIKAEQGGERLGSPNNFDFELGVIPAVDALAAKPPGARDAILKQQQIYRKRVVL
ncbi:MAG: hypothetical protein AAFV29_13800 [Myxococcota bacterium]